MESQRWLPLVALALLCFCAGLSSAQFEGDLRLVDNFNNTDGVFAGRLEVFYNGTWGTVCDDGFDFMDADVACRQLGFVRSLNFNSVESLGFQQGESQQPIFLDELGCDGFESQLISCSRNEIGIHDCSHFEDVGLECTFDGSTSSPFTPTPFPCSEGQVEQIYENTEYSSYIENGETYQIVEYDFRFCYNGVYGSLCDVDWDNDDANVLCREFGNYEYVGEALSGISDGGSVVHGVSLSCNGTEGSLSQCVSTPNAECSLFSNAARLRCTQVPQVCAEGSVRLTNQTYDFSTGVQTVTARVDVCVNGSYSALCDVGFDDVDAAVGCNYLGNFPPFWEAEAAYGAAAGTSWDGTVSYQDVMCNGTEQSPSECAASPVTDPSCYNSSRLAAIRCTEVLTQCFNDGDFISANITNELSGPSGEYSFTARVDVCFNGTYGSVCDLGFDEIDAEIFCQTQLGSGIGIGAIPLRGSVNGVSRAGIVLEEIRCNGTEGSIYDCPRSQAGEVTNPQCQAAAAVTCSRVCYDGSVRIVGGNRYGEGRVEVCKNNVWGTICDEGWDDSDARVACRAFRFEAGGVAVVRGIYGPGTGPILASGVRCTGEEFALYECGNDTVLSANCTHGQDAGVMCEPGSFEINVRSRGFAVIGSDNFYLSCDVFQRPWTAGVSTYEWSTDSENPLTSNADRIIDSRTDVPYFEAFEFNGTLSFNRLSVGDLGLYTCLVSLNLTYPDGPNNSSAIVTNTSTFELTAAAPPLINTVETTANLTVGSPFTASCIVSIPSELLSFFSVEWIPEGSLPDPARVTIGRLRTLNSTHVVLDADFSNLELVDTGFYSCVSSVGGQYIRNATTRTSVFLQVQDSTFTPTPSCSEGTPILTNLTFDYSEGFAVTGRVDICVNGLYSPLCDIGFDDVDAAVACSYFGYPEPFFEAEAAYGAAEETVWDGTVSYQDLNCTGSEESPSECPSSSFIDASCNIPSRLAAIRCSQVSTTTAPFTSTSTPSTSTPFNGQLRLVDNFNNTDGVFAGRLEVFYNGTWGTVCDDDFDFMDADVACRQLGFVRSLNFNSVGLLGFQQGESQQPIFLDGLGCSGFESQLFSCPHNGIGIHDCSHSEDVGLECTFDSSTSSPFTPTPFPCSEGQVEQIYENTEYSSYIENGEIYQIVEYDFRFCYNGVYGSLCDVDWDNDDANVLCREFGNYEYVGEALSGISDGGSVIHGVSLSCNGTEGSLSQCVSTPNAECSLFSNVARLRCTQVPQVCAEGSVRLTNQTYDFSTGVQTVTARVDVCVNGSYSALCDVGFDDVDAAVGCNYLGNFPPFWEAEAAYGAAVGTSWDGTVSYQDVMCNGTEQSPSECAASPVTDSNCYDSSRLAAIRCTEVLTQCFNDGDFISANITNESSGPSGEYSFTARVDVCFNGTYGSVCDLGFDEIDAEIFCQTQLGSGIGIGAIPLRGSVNGVSRAGIVLEEIRCNGTEGSIYDCPRSQAGEVTNPQCQAAAAVTCSRVCYDGSVRIVGGNRYGEGRVEVCKNNVWGTICDEGWDDSDARVACRAFRFEAGGVAVGGGMYGPGTGPILASGVRCTGEEFALYECGNDTVLSADCTHGQDAGVMCAPGSFEINVRSRGFAVIGSDNFYLSCDVFQRPWTAGVSTYEWSTDSENPLTSNADRIIDSRTDVPYSEAFEFNGTLSFNRLSVGDLGLYTCLVSLNLTYPDGPNNSSAIVTNTSTFELTAAAPPLINTVETTTNFTVGSPFTASCIVSIPSELLSFFSVEWIPEGSLPDPARVTIGRLRTLNSTHVVLDADFSNLELVDTGFYSCVSSVGGQYIRNATTTTSLFLQVQDSTFTPTPSCSEGTPILTNLTFDYSEGFAVTGRVDICVNGLYSPLCDIGFDDVDAAVACSYFGYPEPFFEAEAAYGAAEETVWDGTVSYQDLMCTGSEQSPSECPSSSFIDASCNIPSRLAAIRCSQVSTTTAPFTSTSTPSTSTPFDGQLRLVDNFNNTDGVFAGRLEVFSNGTWGTVCDDDFDFMDADVACRQLGFVRSLNFNSVESLGFQQGESQQPIFLDGLGCSGFESQLFSCPHNGIGIHDCSHFEDVGLECTFDGSTSSPFTPTPFPCSEGQVGQIYENTEYSSYIENGEIYQIVEYDFRFCYNGVYGSLCDVDWDNDDANVLCREFGNYEYVGEALSGISDGGSVIHGVSLSCNGTEGSLSQCVSTPNAECSLFSNVARLRCTQVPQVCAEGSVRLTNQTYDFSTGVQTVTARVDVCVNGSYSALCDVGFDNVDAAVGCNYLGNFPPFWEAEAAYGAAAGISWDGTVSYQDVMCNGTEQSPSECAASPVTDSSCYNSSRLAAIRCTEVLTQCFNDGDFISANITNESSGPSGEYSFTARVDVCFNGTYGSVCDLGFDEIDAEVFCQTQLGSGIGIGAIPLRGSVNGVSRAGIVLEEIRCNGTEGSIYDCPRSQAGEVTNPQCQAAAAVTCSRVCYDGSVRIVGGNRYGEGRVEVCKNNVWGTICDEGWDDSDARVACRAFRFEAGGVAVVGGEYGPGTGPILASGVRCTGEEFALYECGNDTMLSAGCTHGQDAGVMCEPGSFEINVRSRGFAVIGSDNFYLSCDVFQRPWTAGVSTYEWSTDSENPLTSNADRIIDSRTDVPYSEAFEFNGTLSFNRLSVGDLGLYTCLVSLNLTYPDGPNNSSAIVTNTSTFELTAAAPPLINTVETTTNFTVGSPFTASCIVSIPSELLSFSSVEWIPEGSLPDPARVTIGPLRTLNSTHVVLDADFSNLELVDTGFYYCVSSVGGQYIRNATTMTSVFLQVQDSTFTPTPSCSEGTPILTNLTFDYSEGFAVTGRVDICVNGLYSPLCDIGFDDVDAAVACSYFGYPEPFFEAEAAYGAAEETVWDGTVSYQDLMCTGSEQSPSECPSSSFIDASCNIPSRLAAIRCSQVSTTTAPFTSTSTPSTSTPFDGQLRLVDNFNNTDGVFAGRLEVFSNGTWGTVCDDDFDFMDADVACRQLGFVRSLNFNSVESLGFQQGESQQPIFLDGLGCSGFESQLFSCPHNGIGIHDCSHFEDVGLECTFDGSTSSPFTPTPFPCSEGQVGQIYENTEYSSYTENGEIYQIVEYDFRFCYNGVYGSLCDVDWDNDDANVLCREFGNYEYVGEALSGISDGGSVIHGVSLSCNGTEGSLSQCVSTPNAECSLFSNVARLRCTQVPQVCAEGSVRLTNQTYDFSTGVQTVTARVDVCVNGSYSALCDVGFDDVNAAVGCNYLGNFPPFWEAEAAYGAAAGTSWDGTVSYQDVMCNGTEQSPSECAASPVTDSSCYNSSRLAAIRCTEVLTQCFNDGDFISANITNESSGPSGEYSFTARVDVCFNGTYGSVCDLGFDEIDAEIFCQTQLGSGIGIGAIPLRGSVNGVSRAGIVLEEIRCNGTEGSIYDCPISQAGEVTNPQCQAAAAVTCSRVCYDGSVRIVGGNRYGEGRVEVCKNNVWGTICDEGWDDSDARVACRAFRFEAGGVAVGGGVYGPGTGPILASGVRCTGEEFALYECGNDTVLSAGCTHGQDAGVMCEPGSFEINVRSRGFAVIGSDNFYLSCDVFQRPWTAGVSTYEWSTDSENPLTSNADRIIDSRTDVPYSEAFEFNGTLSFNRLSVGDLGLYTCLVSLNLTYPDGPNNSSAIVTNTSTFELTADALTPTVSIAVGTPEAVEGRPFSASCIVSTTSDFIDYLTVEWVFENELTDPARVTIGPQTIVNSTHVVFDAVFSALILSDTGFYTCVANISGQFLRTATASSTLFLSVQASTATPPVTPVTNVTQGPTMVTTEATNQTDATTMATTQAVNQTDATTMATTQAVNQTDATTMATTQAVNQTDATTMATTQAVNQTDATTMATTQAVNQTDATTMATTQAVNQTDATTMATTQAVNQTDATTMATTQAVNQTDATTMATTQAVNQTDATTMATTQAVNQTDATTMATTQAVNQTDATTMATTQAVNQTDATTMATTQAVNQTDATTMATTQAVNQTDATTMATTQAVNQTDATTMATTQAVNQTDATTMATTQAVNQTDATTMATTQAVNQTDATTMATTQAVNQTDATTMATTPVVTDAVTTSTQYIPPTIIEPPKSNGYQIGVAVNLTCLSIGSESLVYQWYLDGVQIAGEDRPYLYIPGIELTQRGIYRCSVTDGTQSSSSPDVLIAITNTKQFFVEVRLNLPNRRKRQNFSPLTMLAGSLNGSSIGVGDTMIYSVSIDSFDPSTEIGALIVTVVAPGGVFPPQGVPNALGTQIASQASSFGFEVTDIRRYDGCVMDDSDPRYTWAESELSLEPVMLSCACSDIDPNIADAMATRVCGGSYSTRVEWFPPNYAACQLSSINAEIICNSTVQDVTVVSGTLVSITENEDDLTQQDLQVIVNTVLDLLDRYGDSDIPTEGLSDYGKVIDNLLEVDSQVILEAQRDSQFTTKVIDSVEQVASRLTLIDNRSKLVRNYFGLASERIISNRFNGSVFNSRSLAAADGSKSLNDVVIAQTASELSTSTLALPSSLFTQLSASAFSYRTNFYTFARTTFFSSPDTKYVSSDIISASIDGLEVSNLSEDDPIVLTLMRDNRGLSYSEEQLDTITSCVFWDQTLNSGVGAWSRAGCKMSGRDEDGHVRCECTHLSSFTLLVNIDEQPGTVPPVPVPASNVVQAIVYVGLAVSIVAVLVCFISHLISKKLRSSYPGILLINICISLLGLYIVFILSAQAPHLNAHNPPQGANLCAFFSALLQYFVTVFLFLTIAEAFFMLNELTKIVKSTRRYFFISIAVSWLLPIAIIAICMGGYEYYLSQEQNFCHPSSWPFWFGFTAVFVIVYILDLFFFVTILFMLCAYYSSRERSDKERANKQLSYAVIAPVLYLFFGIAWIFVLIFLDGSLSSVNIASEYIYAFFFAIHSILLLILHAACTPDTRAVWTRWWYTLTCRRDAYHVHLTSGGVDSPTKATYLSNRSVTNELEEGVQLQEAGSEPAVEFVKGMDTSMAVENLYTAGPNSGEIQETDGRDTMTKKEQDKMDALTEENASSHL